MANDGAPWYRDAAARSLILRRYVPWLAGLSLAWEIAQLPLYTLWDEADPGYIAFAVVHCTIGDILIGTVALALSLILMRAGSPEQWPRARIAVLTVIMAVAYTAVSEWTNTVALRSWEYSSFMPRVELGKIELGLSPLAQWLLIPPLAFWLAFRLSSRVSPT